MDVKKTVAQVSYYEPLEVKVSLIPVNSYFMIEDNLFLKLDNCKCVEVTIGVIKTFADDDDLYVKPVKRITFNVEFC